MYIASHCSIPILYFKFPSLLVLIKVAQDISEVYVNVLSPHSIGGLEPQVPDVSSTRPPASCKSVSYVCHAMCSGACVVEINGSAYVRAVQSWYKCLVTYPQKINETIFCCR